MFTNYGVIFCFSLFHSFSWMIMGSHHSHDNECCTECTHRGEYKENHPWFAMKSKLMPKRDGGR